MVTARHNIGAAIANGRYSYYATDASRVMLWVGLETKTGVGVRVLSYGGP